MDPATGTAQRISESGGVQIEAALRSLGAKVSYDNPAVTEPAGKLDGIETYVAAVPGNHYQYDFPYLTGNVVLWPRPLVLFAGPDVSSDDLAVLRTAAKQAIPDTLALDRSLETEAGTEVCRTGLKSVSASAGDVDALRAAFQPVTQRLERDKATGAAVARIEQLSHEGGGGSASFQCPDSAKPATRGTIPPGTYRTFLTRADAREHGFSWAQVVEEDPDPRGAEGEDEGEPARVHRAGHLPRLRRVAGRHREHRLGGLVLDLPRPHHHRWKRGDEDDRSRARSTGTG